MKLGSSQLTAATCQLEITSKDQRVFRVLRFQLKMLGHSCDTAYKALYSHSEHNWKKVPSKQRLAGLWGTKTNFLYFIMWESRGHPVTCEPWHATHHCKTEKKRKNQSNKNLTICVFESNCSHVRGDAHSGQTWQSRSIAITVVAPRLHTSQLPLLLINILTALQYDTFQRRDHEPLW